MGRRAITLEAINERLKAACIPVRARRKGDSLYLRCSKLPPKPGDPPGKRYEIPQGSASASNLARMESEAHALWQAVIERRFSWPERDRGVVQPETVGDWLERFEEHYLKSGQCTPRTFQKFWKGEVLDRLPQSSRLTPALVLAAVLATPENSRLRRQTCQKLSRFAEFAGLEVNLRGYQGTYGLAATQHRELPTDEQIEAWYLGIPNERWRRIFGRIAAFGLRPSESFAFELLDAHTARVVDAKSGMLRDTKAFHPEWAERWDLAGAQPRITWRADREHEDISQRIATRLRGYGVSCQRYDLRHAWCVRVSVEYKIPVAVAAKWAGHSEDLHLKTYNRWIRGDQQDRVYREMVLRKPEL